MTQTAGQMAAKQSTRETGELGHPESLAGSNAETLPWYQERGVQGMRSVVKRLERIAQEVNSQAGISSPYVHRFGYDCDGQDESVYVVVDVHIPAEHDGTDFRDRFFDRLAEALEPEDGVRLAVGVRRFA